MKLDAHVHKPVLQAHRHACHTVGSLLHRQHLDPLKSLGQMGYAAVSV